MSANFHVYVNHPNDKALIHHADCPHCNHGEGRTAMKSAYNGQWHGPYDESTAIMKASRSGKSLTRWCKLCADRLGISPGNV